MGVVLYYI